MTASPRPEPAAKFAPVTRRLETTIVVAGAGPVGMSLAIDAARRGVDVIVLEARQAGEPPSAKCNTVAARTLETFRRLGVSDEVRAAGLPDDYPTDVIYCTAITGYELTRIRQPSRRERGQPGFIDSDWPTPEPVVRVSQLYLEPILFRRLGREPGARVLNQTVVEGYEQDRDGVTVFCRAADGEAVVVRGRFLVGCDGGRSTVRRIMGVQLQGDAVLGRTRSSLIRAPGLRALFGDRRPVWMSWVSNPRARGTVVAIDGKDVWLVHRSLGGRHRDFADLDFDQSIRDVLGVGPDFTWEVLNHEDWVGRRLVAERFRDGAVFIAGDAAHLWGALRRIRHERRRRRRHVAVVDALRSRPWVGGAGLPRRLRGRAAADHRAGFAPGDRQGDGERRGARRGSGSAAHRIARSGRR